MPIPRAMHLNSDTVGYFSTEDRDAVTCLDCADEMDDNNAHCNHFSIDDPISWDWDGAPEFVCEYCGKHLYEVAGFERDEDGGWSW